MQEVAEEATDSEPEEDEGDAGTDHEETGDDKDEWSDSGKGDEEVHEPSLISDIGPTKNMILRGCLKQAERRINQY